MNNRILDGVVGLCVADALGVPVEFQTRAELDNHPVLDMREYGTYHQPKGTWSDDTSMTLCLIDSLCNGLDYDDIMSKFILWLDKAKYTPHDEVFDVGNATRCALMRYKAGVEPLSCGGTGDYDNGNGSLMRILPIAFYLHARYGDSLTEHEDAMGIIRQVSSLTHAHKRCHIACGIYVSIASMLIGGMSLDAALDLGIVRAMEYYGKDASYEDELIKYAGISNKAFSAMPRDMIKSSGYVVDTLEAAVWCLRTTGSYKDCVLKAVNLGGDTDTVAAVAGGLAGLYYGYENIPENWLIDIVKRGYIENLCKKLYLSLK